ncbi:hypothetical protein ACIBAH_29200 [Streptomyces sp. NPDC051445]|uniref:hypothetical protein n=1 Tax=Streptomyces sp. NPDC051445 TaxID=3365653 RepID=UPI0037BA3DB8
MNKSAVAMAADSTVTIASGRRGIKTYDTVNKLFELIEGTPVGVMVYDNSELSGMPWETIIACYRESRSGKSFDRLEDYALDLLQFITQDESMITIENEEFTVLDAAHAALVGVFDLIMKGFESCFTKEAKLVKVKLKRLVDTAIEKISQEIDKEDDGPWADKLPLVKLRTHYSETVMTLIEELFDKFDLNRTQKKRLIDIALNSIRKADHGLATSGLVVGGFGQSDYFPGICHTEIGGRVLGTLLADPLQSKSITLTEPGHLETFAQDEMAWGFLSGINGKVRNSIIEYWSDWVDASFSEAKKSLKSALPKISEEDVEVASTLFHRAIHNHYREFLRRMQHEQETQYIEPMWQSIASLPKGELGVFAESMVNLTSLKQRVSIYDTQTVGGEIDVALISRSDGFVWLKRKNQHATQLG